MSKQNRRKRLLVAVLGGITILAVVLAHILSGSIVLATNPSPRLDLTTLSDRTQWHQVNASPYILSAPINALCAAPTSVNGNDQRRQNPHAAAAITVFVNRLGRDAMLSATPPQFPVGSVIVKQKMALQPHQKAALLYTVMIKRDRGYNPAAGDWEFAVVSGNGKQIQARGALANCMACHLSQRGNNYVFRTYLGQ